ncbi:hypothetical protein MED134_06194 [Dokdonia sp. MED134]|uniref:hypothetical protein n=1 Tax=Dokdonia sp. MED134 TaxID=313590 RepID=UPI000068AADA|nr:hypothetical protein [Dokdonia sp. MED134]EAQ40322.1 hypothetical protein MED134_06194 [Dokdonia sp. MED134]
MKKIGKTILMQAIYLILFYFIIYRFKNYELAMLIFFIPFLTYSILTFRKFEKITESKTYIMLSKSNYNYWNIGFVVLIIFLCLQEITIYKVVLLTFAIIYLFLEYTISKRRVIDITKNGIDELGKNKHRELNEITMLNIYPNNVEFRFNQTEILQINQNELLQPSWNNFLENIEEIQSELAKN